MRAVLPVVVLVAAGCVDSRLQQCASGVVCPENLVCAPAGDTCITREERAACDGLADEDPCMLATTPNGSCRAGLCVAARPRLSVVLAGTGAGRVTSQPPGIDCGTSCAFDFAHGTAVTLTAQASGGSTFTGWSAPCGGTAECVVAVMSSRTIGATFTAPPAPMITGFVPAAGAGRGQPVTILGTNLVGTSAVTFNGQSQPEFTIVSMTRIDTTVPAGATSGPVAVTTAGGTASALFSVLAVDVSGSLELPAAGAGCVAVGYTLQQTQSRNAEVTVEVDPGTGVFQRATGVRGNPMVATTSPQGTYHEFRWNSAADTPGAAPMRATVRVVAGVHGVPDSSGISAAAELTVNNLPGLAFATPVRTRSTRPRDLAIADVDSDGRKDLIVVSDLGGANILPANDDGTFGTPVGVPEDGSEVETADVDGDAAVDLVLMDALAVKVLLGRGDGSFEPAIIHAGVPEHPSVAIADLDGDGTLDLAVAGDSDDVVILRGAGDGSFHETGRLPVAGARVAAGDINRDGRPDLVALSNGSLSIFLANGAGGFVREPSYDITANSHLRLADLDGNGELDVLAMHGSGILTVLLARLDGEGFHTRLVYDVPVNALDVVIADLDLDGDLDVAVPSLNRKIAILRGTGDGGFFEEQIELAPTGPIWAVAAADLTDDGKPELIIAEYERDQVATFINTTPLPCEPTYVAMPPIVSPSGGPVAIGDVDGDGRPDLAIADPAAGGVALYHGKGDGTFGRGVLLPVPRVPAYPVLADVSGDGALDLLVLSVDPTALRGDVLGIFLGKGDGSFEPRVDLMPELDRYSRIVVADHDRDGKPDVVVGGRGVTIHAGVGGGSFAPPATVFAFNANIFSLAVADVNQDGAPDIIAGGDDLGGGGLQVVLRRRDGGRYDAPVAYGAHHLASQVTVGDLDHDGDIDLVSSALASVPDGTVVVLRGAGDGTFGAPVELETGGYPNALALADLDRDGTLDIAATNHDGAEIAILHGDGRGGFADVRHVPVGTRSSAISVGDLDRDGTPDLVVVNESFGVSVLLAR